MADWFDELVQKTCAEVLAREDVRDNLADADPARVTASSITKQVVGSDGDIGRLRELLADPIHEVERADRYRDGMLREVLPRESTALAEAEARLQRARQQLVDAGLIRGSFGGSRGLFTGRQIRDLLSAGARIARDYVRRWLSLGRAVTELDLRVELASAEKALEQAQQAFSAAATDESIRQHPALREVDGARANAILELRGQLVEVLARQINLIIDGALTASYEPEFSYSGSAWLVDQPTTDALGAEVNGEAVNAIRNMIDSDLTGAVGVAGPRGIGKTTLLTRLARPVTDLWHSPPFVLDVNTVRQWGVSVAAPAQYDARDFLLHLFGQLCVSVLGEERVQTLEDQMTGTDGRPGRSPFPVVLFASYFAVTALMCGAVVIGLEASRPVGHAQSMADLLIAGCCGVVAVAAAMVPAGSLRSWGWRMAQNELRRLEWAGLSRQEAAISYRIRSEVLPVRIVRARAAIVVISGISACVLFSLVALGSPPNPGYLAAIGLAVPAVPALVVLRSRIWEAATVAPVQSGYAAQISAAESWYRKVKFQQSYTTGWSGTVTLSPSALPVQAQAGWSGSKATTPVSMSVPEIVTALRSFSEVLRNAPSTPGRSSVIPVVIGIDEVDKIEDPQTAQAFFNQIKGLFGNTPCLFLISISDDAMAAYERRGLPLRDAFDSSLSTVITLSYLSRGEARRLIGSRLVRITEPSADLLYVLSGGLPRELVRLIRRAVDFQRAYTAGGSPMDEAQAGGQPEAVPGPVASSQAPGSEDASGDGAEPTLAPVPLDLLAVVLTAEQVAAQRRAVLIRGRVLEPCQAKNTLLAWAGDPAADAWLAGPGGAAAPAKTGYFADLLGKGVELMGACDLTAHADSCAARETGAFLFWLATVGQVFGSCQTRADFEDAEHQGSKRSFERLARARQNFSLGPGYVQAAVTEVRIAWDLAVPPQLGNAT
jgi:hypothetical protein